MAKAKKRVAARKKSLKRSTAKAKPARKLAAKHVTPKKAKSKVRRAGMSAKNGGKKTSDGDASRNQGYRRHRGADQPHRGPGHLTSVQPSAAVVSTPDKSSPRYVEMKGAGYLRF